jgi:hypothetical protein
VYAGTEADWDRVAARLFRAAEAGEPIGLDSEFFGLDVTKESCAGGRARIHVWSVAVFTGKLSPRGHRRAAGVTLPAAALEHPGLVTLLEDPGLVKAVHNLPVDHHALATSGVRLGGGVNTLSIARWVWPGRAADGSGFGLKSLMRPILGRTPIGDFRDVLSLPATTWEMENKKRVRGLWRKEWPDGSITWMREHPLQEVHPEREGPGFVWRAHPLWDRLVPYAAEDAECALELLDAAERAARRDYREVPW